ncbi:MULTISPECIES: OB-fold domain-containing protein [unclassified Streptomyces]|uniref:Zn-ribbon domain-containing OB-fold protein n=1 Tax=unclassified Streptomyces TaxID=2593676 RepID=UPI002DDAA8F7|nr:MULTISPECIES: OB-fold domain-containing protein [unclassified Streptomyces]WSA96087.1 OB-fold domain-containing protein [Streptomyces sp. NBC_01795]WSB80502.1 OB-fold domain-containing protein [Streptomyces sp. NBC_01775]WSS11291.1 OB-fold domain-containing protein [Streptomyces sp. NBC_01186]WSS40001.1 OB-fold domain-containing protein [Streptomyces sp. NBC_01187]
MVTDPGSPATAGAGLQGSRCFDCSVTVYPADDACPRCGGPAGPAVLSGTGTLWTWTVQRYPPKSPPYQPPAGGFAPFALGYVQLTEGVRVAAVLEVDDLDGLRIDMPLTVTAGEGVPRARPTTAAEGGS